MRRICRQSGLNRMNGKIRSKVSQLQKIIQKYRVCRLKHSQSRANGRTPSLTMGPTSNHMASKTMAFIWRTQSQLENGLSIKGKKNMSQSSWYATGSDSNCEEEDFLCKSALSSQ